MGYTFVFRYLLDACKRKTLSNSCCGRSGEKKLEEQRNQKKKLIEAANTEMKVKVAELDKKKAELEKKKAKVDEFIKAEKNERDVYIKRKKAEIDSIRAIPDNQITLGQ
uniref:Uncharacterized protein n=1 Tax=Ditylenchus dipsaci TaxID=166011 RepID=A0A915CRZ4_9BILA